MVKKRIKGALMASLLAALSLGLMMAFVDRKSQWYQSLMKSPFQPDASGMLAAWMVMYFLLAVAFFWTMERGMRGRGLYAYLLHFAALPLYSYLFFATRNPITAAIALFCGIVTALLAAFWSAEYSRGAAWLWVPHIGWLALVMVFCYAIVMLN